MKTYIVNHFLNENWYRLFPFVIISRKKYDDLNHFADTTVGLYAIDQDPEDVGFDWVLKHNFRIEDVINKDDSILSEKTKSTASKL